MKYISNFEKRYNLKIPTNDYDSVRTRDIKKMYKTSTDLPANRYLLKMCIISILVSVSSWSSILAFIYMILSWIINAIKCQ